MIFPSAGTAVVLSPGDRLFACIGEHGSAAHPYPASKALLTDVESDRNLADAIHFLCSLHGRHPGVIARAAARSSDPDVKAWLEAALHDFMAERSFIARLAVDAGPPPAMPGAAGAEAALLAQRHALDMLAQSERNGCGLGAAMALLADWSAARLILNTAAGRFGVAAPQWRMVEEPAIRAAANRLCTTQSVERAMLFGAEQLLLQHKGLWDILEARALARVDA